MVLTNQLYLVNFKTMRKIFSNCECFSKSPNFIKSDALSLILNDTSKATKTILRNPVRHLSKFHENLVYRTFQYYIYYLSSSGCAYPTQLDTQNEATTPISGPEELRVSGVQGSKGSRGLRDPRYPWGSSSSRGSSGPRALCVEMGFTGTFTKNQDATVKLKPELISIKFYQFFNTLANPKLIFPIQTILLTSKL